MEIAINCVALFYKVGSSIRDFSRKEKFRKLVKREITLNTQRGSSASYVFIYF